MALSSLTFVRNGRYANPSRLHPSLVTCRPADNSFVTFKDYTSEAAMFMSTIVVNESHLASPKRIGTSGLLRYISGIFHTVEWERACSFFCMAFSDHSLVGQVGNVAQSTTGSAKLRHR